MAERSEVMEQDAVRDASPGYLVEAGTVSAEDVPQGYKRTEVGVIPEDWSTETLFTLADCSKSRFDDGDWVEAEFLTTSGVRLLQTGNIGIGIFIEKESKKYISTQSFDELRCKDVFPGDLLICRLADPAGRACIAPDVGEKRMITSVDVTIFRPVAEVADPNFLLGIFCTPRWFAAVSDRCGGSTRTRISRSQLAQIPVALPSIQEQRAIATALSDADALIESLDRLIAKKRAIKQAAMQQLLTGQTRLPGFTGEWEMLSLSEHAILKARIGWQGLRTDEYLRSGNYYLVTGTDFENGGINWHGCYFVNQWRYDQDRNIQLTQGDVLLTKDGTIGKVGFVDDLPGPATLNSGVYVVRPTGEDFDPKFLFYVFSSTIFGEFLGKLQAGSTISHLYQKDFVGFSFSVPSVDEQAAIASVLSDMDTEIEALEHRRDKARRIKQGMMQQLLTGRVRLVEPQRMEPAAC